MDIKIGDKFRHYKNGKVYVITNTDVRIQQNDEWLLAIEYRTLENEFPLFVRSREEFEEKFSKIKEYKKGFIFDLVTEEELPFFPY